ncbi:unnamed protein product [Orchesella dallaii]|uniref:Protein piccolo n=1 Tax=Orchesella dallaii TaxID=48710 RepID=A0ABP1Q069_9HEXA
MTRISGDGEGSVGGMMGSSAQQSRRESSVQWDTSPSTQKPRRESSVQWDTSPSTQKPRRESSVVQWDSSSSAQQPRRESSVVQWESSSSAQHPRRESSLVQWDSSSSAQQPRRESSVQWDSSAQQSRRESSVVQWDSSSPGSSNPPSRRSSRSRSLVPAGSTDPSAVMEQQVSFQRQQSQNQQQHQKTTKKSQTQHLPRSKKKYTFPVKKYWLSRDPKDRSVGGNGVGMRIVGGKELAESGGRLAAYVARIFPGGLVEHIGGIHEGDVVVEWNGRSLGNKTFEEVSSILSESASNAEFEVIIRSDYNVLTGKSLLPGSGDEDYSRRQSDCGTDMGSGITDSQSICLAHQDTTDDNESDKSRPGEGTYSSSCTLASETTTPGKSSYPQTTTSLTQAAQEYDDRVDETYDTLLVQSPSTSTIATTTSVATSSFHQSLLAPDDPSSGRIPRRHSALTAAELENSGSRRQRPSVISQNTEFSSSSGGGRRLLSLTDAGTYAINSVSGNFQNSSVELNPPSSRRVSVAPKIFRKRSSHGHIYLQICHDPKASILYVTVLKAKLSKPLNEDGTDQHVPVDPYVVCNLYPERVLENQRRTRHVPMCSEPEFHQTMVYPNVSVNELKEKLLEVCVWNYNSTGDDELFGKVILPLSEEGILDEQPHSYPLRLEEKPYRKRSSSASAFPKSSMSSGKSSIDLRRGSEPTSACPLSSAFSLTGMYYTDRG